MKLWCFVFTDPKSRLISARVAAPNRPNAILQMQDLLHEPMTSLPGRAPAPGVILDWLGEDDDEIASRVISVVRRRDNQLLVANR